MTVDALRGKSARSAGRGEADALPIGEDDANIFDCPACRRPLATGSSRCPGCATRLVAGVKLSKAVGFIVAGGLAGAFIGGGVIGAAAVLAQPATVAVVETPPVVAPSSAPIASAPAPVVAPTVPATAVSALRQSALLNQRLVADTAHLAAVLALDEPSSVEIARALRTLAASAAFGDRIAPDVADWPEATAVSVALVDFYAAIGGTAREGLSYSLNSTAAYVAAGEAMLAVMAGLPDLDAAARAVAMTADIDLPVVPLPSVAP